MEGRIVLITGATDGIGRETAAVLAGLGATVIVHGRTADRCAAAREQILRRHPHARVETEAADLAAQEEVRALAGRIIARFPALHVLINNAGVYMRRRVLSPEGIEMTFAVNHLAPFLLTTLLLDLLRRSAPARIITVSSIAHTRAKPDFSDPGAERRYDAYDAYALSKLANILFTVELAARLNGSRVTSNCLHPGVVATKLLRAGFPGVEGSALAEGAATAVHLASAPETAGVTGRYFVNSREQRSSGDSTDPRFRRELWAVSERLTGAGQQ